MTLTDCPNVEIQTKAVSDVFNSGLRWTLWLSVLTAPCGYATSILLAHVGPEAIGAYGVLSLYVALTSVFFFFGGPAVPIRFVPKLVDDRRLRFLYSYLMVMCAAALPYQIAASIWPKMLTYIFGVGGDTRLYLTLIWTADVYIISNLILAVLKAVLDIQGAQILTRLVTIASLLVYGGMYWVVPMFLIRHYVAIIWSTYLTLTLVCAATGLWRLVRSGALAGQSCLWPPFLPLGFWPYTLGLQASSVLGFLSTRLDYFFVLNAGGLGALGQYVALMTFVSVAPMFATFILDSFLPHLSATLASGDLAASAQVTNTYIRLILLLGCAATTFIVIFHHTLIHLLGPKYVQLESALCVAMPFAAVQIVNWIVGTIFSAIGQPHRDAAAKAFRTCWFCALFWPLWNAHHFTGAIWAWGFAEIAYQCFGLALLIRRMPFRLTIAPTYLPALLVTVILTAYSSSLAYAAMPLRAVVWLASILVFLALSRYGLRELVWLMSTALPGVSPRAAPALEY